MKVKKSNIDIVKDYLSGQRPWTTVGYVAPKIIRKNGEEWVDSRGTKWVQRNGYKTKVNEQTNIIRAAIQRKCKCGQDVQYGSKLDSKFFSKTGKCYECVIKEETELRVLGVFGYYETYKVLSNYLGFLHDTRRKIQDSINYFETETDTLKVLCNSEGFIERFNGLNSSDLLDNAKKDLTEVLDTIDKVKKDKNIARKIYRSELAKAKRKLKRK